MCGSWIYIFIDVGSFFCFSYACLEGLLCSLLLAHPFLNIRMFAAQYLSTTPRTPHIHLSAASAAIDFFKVVLPRICHQCPVVPYVSKRRGIPYTSTRIHTVQICRCRYHSRIFMF